MHKDVATLQLIGQTCIGNDHLEYIGYAQNSIFRSVLIVKIHGLS